MSESQITILDSRLQTTVNLSASAVNWYEVDAPEGELKSFLQHLIASIGLRFGGNARGLLQPDTFFRPQAGLTRAELAHAMAIIETRAIH